MVIAAIEPNDAVLFQEHLRDILHHFQWNFVKDLNDTTLTTNMFKFCARGLNKSLKENRHVCVIIFDVVSSIRFCVFSC